MNKRIKKLAEHSGFHFYDMHDVDGQDLGETVEADSWTAAEKFAELIIKDCIKTLKFRGFDDAVPYIEWMAKSHFGVE